MEPADQAQLQTKLEERGAILEDQQRQLLAIMQQVHTMAQQVHTMTLQMADLNTAVQVMPPAFAPWAPATPPLPSTPPGLILAAPPAGPVASLHEPSLPTPEKYDGEPGSCRSFLTQCQLLYMLQPRSFPTEKAKVAYIITQLTGKARRWGTAAWEAGLPCVQTSGSLSEEMIRIFDQSELGDVAGREILRLRQGESSVSDYSIDFQTLAINSGLVRSALFDAFLHGLAKRVKDKLLTRDLPEDLDQLISLAIRVDSRLEERRRVMRPQSPPVRSYQALPRSSPPLAPPAPRGPTKPSYVNV